MARMLIDNDCLLEDVVLMKNPQLTQKVLEQTNFRCNSEVVAVKNSMEAGDMKNLKVLVHYGRGWKNRRAILEREILGLIAIGDLTLAKLFVKQMINWNIIDQNFVISFRFLFQQGTHEVVRMLLESKIDEHVREKFGMELLVNVFGNPKVNVTELLENRAFDVNMQDSSGETALHSAVENDVVENVRFLLSHGADANAKECAGWTPLFVVKSTECMELLLKYGGNLQCVDKDEYTIFDSLEPFSDEMTKAALANLAVAEHRGTTVRQVVRDRIRSNETFRSFYKSCHQQIELMKEQPDLFAALRGDTKNAAEYLSNSEISSLVLGRKLPGSEYLHSVLERILNGSLDTVNLRQNGAEFAVQNKDVCDPYQDITAKIVNHSTFEYLLVYIFIFLISIRILF